MSLNGFISTSETLVKNYLYSCSLESMLQRNGKQRRHSPTSGSTWCRNTRPARWPTGSMWTKTNISSHGALPINDLGTYKNIIRNKSWYLSERFGSIRFNVYFCTDIIVKFLITANMATKIQQIPKSEPNASLLFGKWLSRQGLESLTNKTFPAGKPRGRRCRTGARTRGAQRDIWPSWWQFIDFSLAIWNYFIRFAENYKKQTLWHSHSYATRCSTLLSTTITWKTMWTQR